MDVSNDSSDDESDDDAVQSSVPTTTVPAQASHVARLVVPGPDGSTLIDTTVESRISRDRKRKHERIPEEEEASLLDDRRHSALSWYCTERA